MGNYIKMRIDLGGGHWGWRWESPLPAKPYDYASPASPKGYGFRPSPENTPKGIAIGLDERHNWDAVWSALDALPAMSESKAGKGKGKQRRPRQTP